ncbi:MAG: hypothetical protein ACYDDA_05200 [Acidiferrobacteraceae bacterium]
MKRFLAVFLLGCGGAPFTAGELIEHDALLDASPAASEEASAADARSDGGGSESDAGGGQDAAPEGHGGQVEDAPVCVTDQAPDGGWDCGGGTVGGSLHPYAAYLCVALNGQTWTPAPAQCGACVSCASCNLSAVCSAFRAGSSVLGCSEQNGEVTVNCD